MRLNIVIAIAFFPAVMAAPVGEAQEIETFLYDAQGRLVSASETSTGNGNAHLATYAFDAADNRTSLTSSAAPPLMAINTVNVNESLLSGRALISLDGRFRLDFEASGNVVLRFGSTVLWQSGTAYGTGSILFMAADGNLVINGPFGNVWSTGTAGNPGARLVLQNDGNLVLFNGSTPIWATNTCCH